MEKQQMSVIFRKLKKEFELDFARTAGICCGSCTWAELDPNDDKRGIVHDWFSSGINKKDWKSSYFYISYSLGYKEMNQLGKRFCELASELFGLDYTFEPLTDSGWSLKLTKVVK